MNRMTVTKTIKSLNLREKSPEAPGMGSKRLEEGSVLIGKAGS